MKARKRGRKCRKAFYQKIYTRAAGYSHDIIQENDEDVGEVAMASKVVRVLERKKERKSERERESRVV